MTGRMRTISLLTAVMIACTCAIIAQVAAAASHPLTRLRGQVGALQPEVEKSLLESETASEQQVRAPLQAWARAWVVNAGIRDLDALRVAAGTAAYNAVAAAPANMVQAQRIAPIVPAPGAARTVTTANGFVFTIDNWGRVLRARGNAAGQQPSAPGGSVGAYLDAMYAVDTGLNGRANQNIWTDGHIIAASLGGPAGGGQIGWTNINAINFFPQMAVHNGGGEYDSPYNAQEFMALNLWKLLGNGCVDIDIGFTYSVSVAPSTGSGLAAPNPLIAGGAVPFFVPVQGTYRLSVLRACPTLTAVAQTLLQYLAANPNPHPGAGVAPAGWANTLAAMTAWANANGASAVTNYHSRLRNWVNFDMMNIQFSVSVTNEVLWTINQNNGLREFTTALPFTSTGVVVSATYNRLVNGLSCSDGINPAQVIATNAVSPAFAVPIGLPGTQTVITCDHSWTGKYVFRVTRIASIQALTITCTTTAGGNVVFAAPLAWDPSTFNYNLFANVPVTIGTCTLTATLNALASVQAKTVIGNIAARLTSGVATALAVNKKEDTIRLVVADGTYNIKVRGQKV